MKNIFLRAMKKLKETRASFYYQCECGEKISKLITDFANFDEDIKEWGAYFQRRIHYMNKERLLFKSLSALLFICFKRMFLPKVQPLVQCPECGTKYKIKFTPRRNLIIALLIGALIAFTLRFAVGHNWIAFFDSLTIECEVSASKALLNQETIKLYLSIDYIEPLNDVLHDCKGFFSRNSWIDTNAWGYFINPSITMLIALGIASIIAMIYMVLNNYFEKIDDDVVPNETDKCKV